MARQVNVLVVGGMARLDAYYRELPPGELAVDIVYADSISLEARALAADALVLVTGQISHAAAEKVRLAARRNGIPLVAATSPSLSRVRAAIASAFFAARATALAQVS